MPILFVPNRSNHGRFFESTTIPYGREPDSIFQSWTFPVAVVSLPTAFGALRGEPRVAVAVEDHRVRIAHARIGHHEVRELARGGVEADDAAVPVAREPHLPLRVDDEVVRVRPRVDLEALELARLRVQSRDVVSDLAHEPDVALLIGERIAWTRAAPRSAPESSSPKRSWRAGSARRPTDRRRRTAREREQGTTGAFEPPGGARRGSSSLYALRR